MEFSYFIPLTLGLLLLCSPLVFAEPQPTGMEGFSTTFSAPPFTLGETVAGIDGWEAVSDAVNRPDRALLQSLPHDSSKTGLLIYTHGIQKMTPSKLVGQARITAVLNLGMLGTGRLQLMPFLGARVSTIEFGYQSEKTATGEEWAGIFYRLPSPAEGEEIKREIVAPRSDLIEGESYLVVLDLDLDAQTFTLRVTGKKADGTSLDALVKDVSFHDKWDARSLNGLRITGGGTLATTQIFLESVSVEPKPE